MELYFKMSEKIILNVFLRYNKCHNLLCFFVSVLFQMPSNSVNNDKKVETERLAWMFNGIEITIRKKMFNFLGVLDCWYYLVPYSVLLKTVEKR